MLIDNAATTDAAASIITAAKQQHLPPDTKSRNQHNLQHNTHNTDNCRKLTLAPVKDTCHPRGTGKQVYTR